MIICSLARQTLASCDCGYVTGDTVAHYTNMIMTNFSLFLDTPKPSDNPRSISDWTVASNTITASWPRTVVRHYNPENEFVRYRALNLRHTTDSDTAGDTVSSASIFSAKSDFLFGGFRMISITSANQTAFSKGSIGGWSFCAIGTKLVWSASSDS